MTTGLFLALLVLAGFALIRRRLWYVKLPAVLGWVTVWFDGGWTTHWWDSLGVAVTATALLFLVFGSPPVHTPEDHGPR